MNLSLPDSPAIFGKSAFCGGLKRTNPPEGDLRQGALRAFNMLQVHVAGF